ncbi:MAG: class I SAM-dependent methyltransferase [Mesorhizobium sp.]|nr:class I SAM-dependent methyltransferase [Mesorhizobium sp.]
MSADAQKTLFHPFDTGDLEVPQAGGRVLFYGAEPGFILPEGFSASITLVQGFRPSFLKLQAGRHVVVPEPAGEGYDMALVLIGRHRGLNEARLADAWDRVREGGLIVAAGSRDDGGDSLRRRVASRLDLEGSLSKYHGSVFWMRKQAGLEGPVATADPDLPINGRFFTSPGMFSHERIDPGSRLLAENLPVDLSGVVADFCAGWGYLSTELLLRCPKVTALELFEADHASLEAAKRNLAGSRLEPAFHWQDLASEPVARRFDAIVMNPPFHLGSKGDPAIGATMIRAASAALKPNGRLIMVGNRHLPYEAALAASFRQASEIVRDQSFKVLSARR